MNLVYKLTLHEFFVAQVAGRRLGGGGKNFQLSVKGMRYRLIVIVGRAAQKTYNKSFI